MRTVEVDALTDEGNWAILRLPSRRFPGVLVQGDSLSILTAGLRLGMTELLDGDPQKAADEIGSVLDTLEQVQRSYEQVLEANSIPLPYLSD